jgi:hypothetical protein
VEVNMQKLRNPRLVLLNIPDVIMLENVEGTLIIQNPELDLKRGTLGQNFATL